MSHYKNFFPIGLQLPRYENKWISWSYLERLLGIKRRNGRIGNDFYETKSRRIQRYKICSDLTSES